MCLAGERMVYYGVLQSRGTGCKVGNADAAGTGGWSWRLERERLQNDVQVIVQKNNSYNELVRFGGLVSLSAFDVTISMMLVGGCW